ncbi:hypothetical protein GYA19_01270 [Candidatus Beckwithbacteria bacterium]|nr:hypothetical protein [Candidatus Beckwithbacteria bacterium]
MTKRKLKIRNKDLLLKTGKKYLKKVKNALLPIQKNFRTKLKEFKKNVVFRFYLWKLKLVSRLRYQILPFFNSYKGALCFVAYFSLLLGCVIFLGRFIDPGFPRSDAATFFTAVAAMIGGILAIIFSLSILLMGNAAERIPVGFYEIAVKDSFHNFIFFLISLCSLTVFTFSLLFGKLGLGLSVASFQATLFLIGTVFYCTFIFYQRVQQRLNPTNVLNIASNQALKKLDSIYKRAEEIAEVLLKQPKLDEKVTKQEAIATSYQYLQPELAYINSRLNYLFDYHDKLVASNERSSALGVLQVVIQILQKYFQTRKDSSFVLPAGFLLATTSDSRAFLTPPLERLVAVGENYMRDNDNEGVTRVISIFVQLCQSASEINYLTKHKVESPIFKQCRGYLDELLDSAIKFNYQEALFQGAVAYSQITPIAIKQGLHHEFISVYDMLDKIAISALTNKFNVVLGEVINTYTAIMSQMISTRYFNLKIELGSLMEHLRKIILYTYVAMTAGVLDDSFVTQTNLATPFDNLSSLIFQVAKVATEAKPNDEKKWKHVFFVVVEELRSTLRFLSEKMKNPNHILVNTFGDMIADIGCLLLDLTQDDKWTKDKAELEKQVGWYIFQTEWFAHDVKKIKDNLAFDSLVEAAAKMGLRALQRNQDQIAKDAIKIISNFAHKMLLDEEGDACGYTEPRIMERACYIGILALKLNKKDVVEELKKYIKLFEEAYAKKWFPEEMPESHGIPSITKDQLKMEVYGIIQDMRHGRGLLPMLDRSSEVLAQLVNEEDVNKFIWEVWKAKIETKETGGMFF